MWNKAEYQWQQTKKWNGWKRMRAGVHIPYLHMPLPQAPLPEYFNLSIENTFGYTYVGNWKK